MFTWIREKGFKANIAEVRKEYPQLLTRECGDSDGGATRRSSGAQASLVQQ